MKKYHIADLLTLSRVFFAAAIVLFTFNGVSVGWAFLMFCIGELTDALDGPFHRRYPYPDFPKKYRFWREGNFPKIFDTGTDIALGLSFLLYVYLRVNGVLAVVVSLPCIGIGFFVTAMIRRHPEPEYAEVIDDMIRLRRILYVCALFVLIIGVTCMFKISWVWKALLIWLEATAAFAVYIFKNDRLKER